ncbi:MAG TPA: hypothetical protein VFV38_37245 [Ktedonobacteraceae bacterium]|nr:hypothetical protein [Ktedonobacteraceae bacterium]
MGTDSFDASIGLAFSLKAFEKYRKNGLLQAEIHHVPGIRGRCKGYLQLIEGKVVMCYIEDKGGYRHAMPISVLIQLDNERGPFDWMLAPLAAPHMASTPRHEPRVPTPRIVALLDLEKLAGWSSEHKHILFQVYQAINGQRNVEDIKHALPFPPYVTEEALHVLSTLKVITESQT